jgi:hypothetical protein
MPFQPRFKALAALLLASTQLACARAQATPQATPQAVTLIHDLQALQAMREQPQGHYALARSIDASATAGWNSGAGFVPIGTAGTPFTGSFDGRGHSIRQLFIHRPGESNVGLFGHARNATLRNVRFSGGQITGGENVGALVGHNEAVDGQARIEQVCAAVSVTGAENVAGLVGHNEAYNGSNLVARARASGAVVATASNVGGLVGHNEAYGGRADIAHSRASGPVAGRDYVGGLVGYNDALRGAAAISHSYATGAVRADGAVAGGLVGLDTPGRITHSFYATTDAQGKPINRYASGAGQGLRLEQLQQLPGFAPGGSEDCEALPRNLDEKSK